MPITHRHNEKYQQNLVKKNAIHAVNEKVRQCMNIFDRASLDEQRQIVEYIDSLYKKDNLSIDKQLQEMTGNKDSIVLLQSFSPQKLQTIYRVLQRKIDLNTTLSEDESSTTDDEVFQTPIQNLPENEKSV